MEVRGFARARAHNFDSGRLRHIEKQIRSSSMDLADSHTETANCCGAGWHGQQRVLLPAKVRARRDDWPGAAGGLGACLRSPDDADADDDDDDDDDDSDSDYDGDDDDDDDDD